MLYLIGLGLNEKGISQEGLEIARRCKKIYLENYTVDFPYNLQQLEEVIKKKVVPANREKIENLEIIDEAEKKDIAILVYGSPLDATTHITLIHEAKKSNIKCKVIHSASIFDAITETGLQLYKFGKTSSMPAWKKNYTPTSFMKIVQENLERGAHSLILCDIGLNFQEAIKQLKISAQEFKIPLKKLIVCQALKTKSSKILYRELSELEEFTGVKKPFCIILHGKLHFAEKEFLRNFNNL